MLDISDDHGDFKLKLINQSHSKSNLRPEVNIERCLVFCLQQYSTVHNGPKQFYQEKCSLNFSSV